MDIYIYTLHKYNEAIIYLTSLPQGLTLTFNYRDGEP